MGDATVKGDHIGWFFTTWAAFWKPVVTFGKDEVAQRNGDILGYFLLQQFLKKISPK